MGRGPNPVREITEWPSSSEDHSRRFISLQRAPTKPVRRPRAARSRIGRLMMRVKHLVRWLVVLTRHRLFVLMDLAGVVHFRRIPGRHLVGGATATPATRTTVPGAAMLADMQQFNQPRTTRTRRPRPHVLVATAGITLRRIGKPLAPVNLFGTSRATGDASPNAISQRPPRNSRQANIILWPTARDIAAIGLPTATTRIGGHRLSGKMARTAARQRPAAGTDEG